MATVNQPDSIEQPTHAPKFSLKIDFLEIRRSVRRLLEEGLNGYQLQLNSRLVSELNSAFEHWLEIERREIASQLSNIPSHAKRKWLEERFEINDRRRPENRPLRLLTDFLFQYLQRKIQQLELMKSGNTRFRQAFSKVRGHQEREKLILNYAAQLGAGPAQLKKDTRAFGRWFDEEAVIDRYAKRIGQLELDIIFCFCRLSAVVRRIFRLARKYHFEGQAIDDGSCKQEFREKLARLWQRLNIESRIHDALLYEGDDRVHAAVLDFLAAATGNLPDDLGAELLDRRTLVFIYRAATEKKSNVWIQCAALSILDSMSFSEALSLFNDRLADPGNGDDIFVRRHVLKLVERRLISALKSGASRSFEMVPVSVEPSPFVRQKMARVAYLSTHQNAQIAWKELTLGDPVEQVRAAGLLAGIDVTIDLATTMDYLDVAEKCLANEPKPFVLRTALHCLVQLLHLVCNGDKESHCRNFTYDGVAQYHFAKIDVAARDTIEAFYRQRIVPLIVRLQANHPEIPVRRWAAQSREKIWGFLDKQAHQLIQELTPILSSTRPGRACRIGKKTFRGISNEKLGRIFALLAQDDFGYDIHRAWLGGYRIRRGPSFGFRLWRLIYEFNQPATDKRQGLRHTIGRISTSTIRAPSQILGELSETKVPGEPLTIDDDGTWRPFLPLPDDFVSILNLSWFFPRKVRFYTSQGVTTVTGPRKLFHLFRAFWKLNFRFAEFASRRNWNEDTFPASAYIDSMRELGFEISFDNYDYETESHEADSEEHPPGKLEDKSVVRFFFPAVLGLPLLGSIESSFWTQIQRFSDYFGSAFENSLEQLVLFAGAILLFVLGKHLYANFTFRRARKKIPITIGGWGTRGKSGTERLKAALIGVMGHGLVSKTTGCEAMFIHANPLGEPLEIPLFRPYDKATIWEQHNLIRMASRMNPSVFLWECMALTPSYVDVLQRQWTCDDLCTITNAYPDHEDVQGPAGYNVAQTISGFVPLNSHLISTEQVMRPYIVDSCREANTSFHGVGWLESGLITEDVLNRFPYKEHPDNIALVATLGDELGCDYEYCLKAMADSLVPDLGVLKTHPVATVRTRKLEFTNGMSANERFGCMGNWRRLGFDDQDPWKDPTTWICGVVNNRADRVPRSKVFAQIMVEDIRADRFFLIGSNLKGLRGFIEDAWSEFVSTISLRDKTHKWDVEFAQRTLDESARDFRQPISRTHIKAKLKHIASALNLALVEGSEVDAEALSADWNDCERVKQQLVSAGIQRDLIACVVQHQREWNSALNEYEELKKSIAGASADQADAIEVRFIATLKTWYDRKIVVIENSDATGEEVIATIVNHTPPGFLNRAMGLQNIKGTGLDFVYRFQAWDVCHQACRTAMSNHVPAIDKAMQTLISMPDIGQLCQHEIREVVRYGRSSSMYRRPELQALLEHLEMKLQAATGVVETQDEANTKSTPTSSAKFVSDLNQWIIESAEQFLDVHDSIRRRDKADLIYEDLAREQISRQRAVLELRKLNKRQKGGWLTEKFRG